MERMTGRLRLAWLFGIIVVTATTADARAAEMESIPAIAGAPFLPSDATCFSTPSFSNRVTNTQCSGNRSWLVPVHVTAFPGLDVHASSAGTGTAPQCRVVRRTNNDGSGALGALVSVGNDTDIGGFSNLLVNDTVHVDCTLAQNGKGLSAVRWIAQ